jgi:hypothetical protein
VLNGSGCRCKVGRVPRVFGGNSRDIVRHHHVLDGIKNNAKVGMSATAASRRNADNIVVDLTHEDLEGSIGRFAIYLHQFPV